MIIKDLPPELQELVHKRQIEQGNDGTFIGNIGNGKTAGNFNWDVSPEGQDFWDYIYHGEDVSNHPMYPKKEYEIY